MNLLYVCMYEGMYVCMYVCAFVCVYVGIGRGVEVTSLSGLLEKKKSDNDYVTVSYFSSTSVLSPVSTSVFRGFCLFSVSPSIPLLSVLICLQNKNRGFRTLVS